MVVLSGIKAYQLGNEALALRRRHSWQSRTSEEREVDALAGCSLKTPMALPSHPIRTETPSQTPQRQLKNVAYAGAVPKYVLYPGNGSYVFCVLSLPSFSSVELRRQEDFSLIGFLCPCGEGHLSIGRQIGNSLRTSEGI